MINAFSSKPDIVKCLLIILSISKKSVWLKNLSNFIMIRIFFMEMVFRLTIMNCTRFHVFNPKKTMKLFLIFIIISKEKLPWKLNRVRLKLMRKCKILDHSIALYILHLLCGFINRHCKLHCKSLSSKTTFDRTKKL